ncbi:MAG: sigma-54-dependent Fis family transcriptional regulator [Candidatus Eisenbacteria bacterium]|uniref:Sigma-54-dependent Fis family transcriptional regulator n=1 Tax=Eiseniibacteriota bacterium TaxID=2212470 RepID=A0A933SDW3_UNCEI|nr:sigma-54-dependent Fis family transcriptional regulator [Candidatus Eisenbacteria bacterium]
MLLRGEGFAVETATSPALVLHAVEQKDFALALLDMNYARDTTSGGEGLDLIERLRALDPAMPVVVMTAWGSVDGAVAAVRRGARDYVQKPWDNDRLLQTLRTQVELAAALRRGARLEQENRLLRRDGVPEIVCESAAMRAALDLAQRVAPSEAAVLITGEHGTGKETFARLVHALGARAHRPFVAVHAGGLSDAAFESELFGHEKGAFPGATSERAGRFELADGGTLFLDDLSGVTPAQQAKLLRVLESGECERLGSSRVRAVHVRVVAASSTDLHAECAAGRFREDLLFRLKTVEIALPPLRERPEDVPALAAFFLHRHAKRYRKSVTSFAPAALQALLAHPWPGNVRELDHAVERAVLLARDAELGTEDLGLRAPADGAPPLEKLTLDEAERLLIQRALARHDGNVSLAARALGLSRSALYRRLERHGIRAAGS